MNSIPTIFYCSFSTTDVSKACSLTIFLCYLIIPTTFLEYGNSVSNPLIFPVSLPWLKMMQKPSSEHQQSLPLLPTTTWDRLHRALGISPSQHVTWYLHVPHCQCTPLQTLHPPQRLPWSMLAWSIHSAHHTSLGSTQRLALWFLTGPTLSLVTLLKYIYAKVLAFALILFAQAVSCFHFLSSWRLS